MALMQCGGAVAVQCIGEAGQRHGGSGFGVNGMKDCIFRLECQRAGSDFAGKTMRGRGTLLSELSLRTGSSRHRQMLGWDP